MTMQYIVLIASHELSACVMQLLRCTASLQASLQAVKSSCDAACSEKISRVCDLEGA